MATTITSRDGRKVQRAAANIINWREWMRKNTRNGAEIHEILLALARGTPKRVKLLDGKTTVIVPTAEVRARVAIHLDEMLHGKAIGQNLQQRAEREAGALAAVQALSDEALADRARAALLRASQPEENALPPGESEAELVEDPVDNLTTVYEIWNVGVIDDAS